MSATPQGTRQVRIADDLATMANGIIEVEGGSVAELLDPIIRETLTARYQSVSPALIAIQNARQSVRGSRAPIAETKPVGG